MSHDDETLAARATELLRATYAPPSDELTEFLHLAQSSSEPRLRVLALRALAGHDQLQPEDLIGALNDDASEVRREAARLSASTNIESSALDEILVERFDDLDSLVIEASIFACGERTVAHALNQLTILATSHDDPRCREAAVVALGTLGDPRGLDAIITALDDRPSVRRRAVVALSNFEGPRVDQALERARQDRDWQVRAAADQLGVIDET